MSPHNLLVVLLRDGSVAQLGRAVAEPSDESLDPILAVEDALRTRELRRQVGSSIHWRFLLR